MRTQRSRDSRSSVLSVIRNHPVRRSRGSRRVLSNTAQRIRDSIGSELRVFICLITAMAFRTQRNSDSRRSVLSILRNRPVRRNGGSRRVLSNTAQRIKDSRGSMLRVFVCFTTMALRTQGNRDSRWSMLSFMRNRPVR